MTALGFVDTGQTSVVIVTRDRADVIVGCLDSLEAQSCPPDEIIIVASDEDAFPAALRAQFNHLPIRVQLCPEANICKARNIGVDHARGSLVLFLDDDARAHTGWIDAFRTLFNSDGSLWAAGGLVIDIRPTPPRPEFSAGLIRSSGTQIEVREKSLCGVPRGYLSNIKGCNFALRLDRMPEHLRFDPFFAFSFDEADLALEIQAQGGVVGYTPEAIVDHLHAPGIYRAHGAMDRDWRTEFASHTMFMLKHAHGQWRLWGWCVVCRRATKILLTVFWHCVSRRMPARRGLGIAGDVIAGISAARGAYRVRREASSDDTARSSR